MKHKPVHQATIHLPHFDYDVPIIYPDGEEGFVPVRAVCDMLGIRADTRIPRWRTLLLWEGARKLPWQREGQRTCIAWCLHLGALPFLYHCFDWSFVLPDRRKQLYQATEEALDVLEGERKKRESRYRTLRQLLFPFLVKMDGADGRLQEKAQEMSSSLTEDAQQRLKTLAQVGCTIIQTTTTIAKNMLHEMGTSWIVDGIQIDETGNITDTFSMPLFPILPKEEDIDAFVQAGRMLLFWCDDLDAFLQAHRLPRIVLID